MAVLKNTTIVGNLEISNSLLLNSIDVGERIEKIPLIELEIEEIKKLLEKLTQDFKGIYVYPSLLNIKVNESALFQIKFNNIETQEVNLTYDNSIIRVEKLENNYKITGLQQGQVDIIIKTIDNKYSTKCTINVAANDIILPIPDSEVRNKVPYLSTYYAEPTISTGENLALKFFITDFYGRSYTLNNDFYRYKVIIKCDGKQDQILNNLSAGEHTVTLGPFNDEGEYHYSIIARDQYGRYSHELFNYLRVRNNKNLNIYTVTPTDLMNYSITYNQDRELKQYVDVNSANGNADLINSMMESAYNNATVPNGKYLCLIPDRTGEGKYEGINNDWDKVKVKYSDDYNKFAVKMECSKNSINISQLLKDKLDQGYNKIIMYNATYIVDENGFDIPSGLEFDMNGSTFKTNPFTGNSGLIARMTDTIDTHVYNGTFEGDYFAHDYENSTSNSEWVSGFEMGGSCRYSSLRDVTIKNITGYGLQNSISNSSSNGNTFFPPVVAGDKVKGFELGDISLTTGQDIPCSYRTRTKEFTDISGAIGKSDFLSVSIHLNYQGNEFSSFNMVVYFYDSARNLIKAVNAYQYRQIKIPEGAHYARTVFLGLREKSDWAIHYHFLRVPTHCKYENVTIDNARCVGMAQGQMKDFLVKNCTITNSGQSSATCSYDAEDGWDGMQDVFFDNFTITECPNNGFVTCAGHNFVIDGMTADKLYMWERSRWFEIKNSNFNEVAIRGGGEKDILKHGICRFHNNTVNGLAYSLNFVSNIVKECNLTKEKPQSGILMESTVNGSYISKEVINNDINNPCINDYGTYENMDNNNNNDDDLIVYGGIITSLDSIEIENGSSTNFSVRLDKEPTNDQIVEISAGENVTISNSSLIFNSLNWNNDQIVTVNAVREGSSTIILSSNNTITKQISVNIIMKDDSDNGDTDTDTNIATVNPTSATIKVNDTQVFTISNTSATIERYSTENSKISIDDFTSTTVTITGRVEGNDNLIIILSDDTRFDIPVTIGNRDDSDPESPTIIPVTGIECDEWDVALKVNETRQMQSSVIPSNATNKLIHWSSSADNIASVDNNGLIVAKSVGYAKVTAFTDEGSFPYDIHVNVSANTTNPPVNPGGGDSSDGSNSETDSNGLVVIKYPASKQLNPKYWGALGDSITAGYGVGGSSYSYANVAGELIGIDTMNYGYTGSCINDGYNTALTDAGLETAFCNRYTEMANGLDLITVLGSVNDHRTDSKIGVEGSTDSKDFFGALHVLITGLKQKYPNSRIVFITPFKIGGWDGRNMYGHTLTDFRNAIVTMCNKHQLEVLDLFTESQFEWLNGINSGYFVPYDYYHPTEVGHKAIANYVVDKMFNGTSGGGSTPPPIESPEGGTNPTPPNTPSRVTMNPSSATISVGNTQTFTLSGTSSTIQTVYMASGKCTIYNQTSTSVTISARGEGQDYLNVILTDGMSLSVSVTVTSSGGSNGEDSDVIPPNGGSGGSSSGDNITIDGLVSIQHPVTKQNTSGEWNALGDSITYGFQVGGNSGAYPAKVANMTNLRANNYGLSGSCISTGFNNLCSTNASQSFCNRYTEMGQANLVTVFGSVNDFLCSVPLGTESSTDKATFYGAMNVLVDGLKSKYPSKRIVIFTPNRIGGHSVPNQQGHTLKDYRNAIVTVCNNKGIEVLDIYSLDSMDADMGVSNYMGDWDTTHPNGNGHQVIADYIKQQMLI